MPYEAELDIAVTATAAAGRIIKRYAGFLNDREVREKGTHDVVTFVDEEAQSVIIDIISEAFPSHVFLAEEQEDTSGGVDAGGAYQWIIDPLDGTTNFTHGAAPYAVSVALQHRGEVVVGVVLDVPANELFTARKGGGVWLNGIRRRVSPQVEMSRALITTGFPFREFGTVDAYLEVLRGFLHKAQGVRRPGSAAVDLAYVACGRYEGFFESGLYPWDVAAGALLIEEGGGRITNFSGERDFLGGRQVVASNGPIHEEMLEIVTPLRTALEVVSG